MDFFKENIFPFERLRFKWFMKYNQRVLVRIEETWWNVCLCLLLSARDSFSSMRTSPSGRSLYARSAFVILLQCEWILDLCTVKTFSITSLIECKIKQLIRLGQLLSWKKQWCLWLGISVSSVLTAKYESSDTFWEIGCLITRILAAHNIYVWAENEFMLSFVLKKTRENTYT